MPAADRNPESCGDCGFRWDAVGIDDVGPRVSTAIDGFMQVIGSGGPSCADRPAPGRWSVLEYSAHLRDVLISIRERVILASVLDNPTGTPMYREERIDLGFYALDTVGDVMTELEASGRLFVRTISALPAGSEDRPLVYSTITPIERTIRWAAAQAVHECEHHLGDVRTNAELRALEQHHPVSKRR
jgi:hypothetical protein